MQTRILLLNLLMLLSAGMIKAQEDGQQKSTGLSAPAILVERQSQLIELFKYRNSELEEQILDKGIYLNKSHKDVTNELKNVIVTSGGITGIEPLITENRLSGVFRMKGENGHLKVLYSISPEEPYKIQDLNVEFTGNLINVSSNE